MIMFDLINNTNHKIPSKSLIWRWICDELQKNIWPKRHLRGGPDGDSSEVKDVSKGHNRICDMWLVEVDIVSVNEIRRLNKRYRKIDQPTDVLSFPIFNNIKEARLARHLRGDFGRSRGGGNLYPSEVKDASTSPDRLERNLLGTIVVCYDIAARQATDNNRSVTSELEILIRHSALHLIGKHHK